MKWKGYDNSLNSWIDKKDIAIQMRYFPELYNHRKIKIKFKLDLSNYATKSNLKRAAGIDTSKFAENVDLTALKSDVDRLDVDKLEISLVDFSKLSNEPKMMLLKRVCIMNWLKKLIQSI